MSDTQSSLRAGLAQVRRPGSARTPKDAATKSAPEPAATKRPTFDERTSRRTFHLDNDLWDELSAAAERTGMSKSGIASRALREYLDRLT